MSALGFLLAALGTSVSQAAESTPEIKPGRVATTFEQLRVNEVADQLIRYLGEAVHWVDKPQMRATIPSIGPAIRSAVMAHPEVQLAREQR